MDKFCPECGLLVNHDDCYGLEDILRTKLAATKEKLARAVVTLEFYADPEHWTIPWIEGSHGDYGNRAREFLKTYREVGSE